MSGSAGSKSKALEDAHFDVTPLVDLVFMMNIYFLVVWVVTALAEVNLPPAKHVVASDADSMVVLAMVNKDGQTGVFVGDAGTDPPLTSPAEIDARVRRAVEDGAKENKEMVLIKAAREVKLRDLAKISSIVTSVSKMKIRLAVMEKD